MKVKNFRMLALLLLISAGVAVMNSCSNDKDDTEKTSAKTKRVWSQRVGLQ